MIISYGTRGNKAGLVQSQMHEMFELLCDSSVTRPAFPSPCTENTSRSVIKSNEIWSNSKTIKSCSEFTEASEVMIL